MTYIHQLYVYMLYLDTHKHIPFTQRMGDPVSLFCSPLGKHIPLLPEMAKKH